MQELARDGEIDYVEFHNEDGNWWGDIVWMFKDGNVGVLATNQNEPDVGPTAFVLKCDPLSELDNVVWCDVVVQEIKMPYNRDTYEVDPGNKPMNTSVRIFIKHHVKAIWFLLLSILFYGMYRRFKK